MRWEETIRGLTEWAKADTFVGLEFKAGRTSHFYRGHNSIAEVSFDVPRVEIKLK